VVIVIQCSEKNLVMNVNSSDSDMNGDGIVVVMTMEITTKSTTLLADSMNWCPNGGSR